MPVFSLLDATVCGSPKQNIRCRIVYYEKADEQMKYSRILKNTFCFLILVQCIGLVQAQEPCWILQWSDEFNGPSIDTRVWNYEIGYIRNQELQYYTNRSQNARIENGNLIIEARHDNWNGHAYTSASLNTQNKKSWKYGRFEMRAKLVCGKGMWPAFWSKGNSGSWPACGEIDVMELVGGSNGLGDSTIHGTMHWDSSGKAAAGGDTTISSGKFADDYHLFAIEWDSLQIKWFLDSSQYFSASITGASRSEFRQPFWILINLAVGGTWPGSPDAATVFPQQYMIDWIRVYKRGFTGISEASVALPEKHASPFMVLRNNTIHLQTPLSEETSYKVTMFTLNGGVCFQTVTRNDRVELPRINPGAYLITVNGPQGLFEKRRIVIR